MLTSRLIACFDVINGRVTKAKRFQNNIDIGDAAAIAEDMYAQQIDEIIFYDILASAERRQTDIETVRAVAEKVFVPLTVGGGVKSVADMHRLLDAGAEKISVDSMAVRNPEMIYEGSREFGRQCIVLSTQVKHVEKSAAIPSGWEVAIDGARVFTGRDAVEWAKEGEALGAGEICVNSIDNDGTHAGYDLEITQAICDAVNVPVIASGGAGTIDHVAAAFGIGASAAIVSSLLYSPRLQARLSVGAMKDGLAAQDVNVRPLEVAPTAPAIG